MSSCEYSIGILSETLGVKFEDKTAIHCGFGRAVDRIAKSFSKCYLCVPVGANDGARDYVLQSDNIELILKPFFGKMFQKMKHPIWILRTAKRLIDASDVIFIRSTMPYLPLVHLYAILRGKPVVQWVICDLLESLRADPEKTGLKGKLKCTLAWFNERWFRLIRKSSGIYILASGCALYERYKSPRTTLVVSSSIREDEFYYREDTCQKDPVRILFIGQPRPGKGLIYLVEALSKLKTSRQVQLAIVGHVRKYLAGKARIEKRTDELGLGDKVSWEGYAKLLSDLFGQMRRSDIFVLPTLSEGAPQVLVEARAFGLPVITTRVGGIPSLVEDGKDGILVAPRDSQALAVAIDKVIEDNRFRKKLISNGYTTAKKFTVEKFAAQVIEIADRALTQRKKQRLKL